MIGIGDITNAKLKVGDVDVLAAYVGDIKVYGSNGGSDVDYSQQYLTFNVLDDNGATFYWYDNDVNNNEVEYSTDNGTTWTTLIPNYQTESFPKGTKVMWRGDCIPSPKQEGGGAHYYGGIGYFEGDGEWSVEGNPMSLLDSTGFRTLTVLPNYAFTYLFSPLEGAVADYARGYEYKLVDITNISLVATTMTPSCYEGMFRGTGIRSIPNDLLPATTLADYCYRGMFNHCEYLEDVSNLVLPATTLAQYCYYTMFYGCVRITTARVLPATTLVAQCYGRMFRNCTNLNYIKCLATDISASQCTAIWTEFVSLTGTFVAANGTSWSRGTSGIPTNWTVQYV